MKGTLYIISGPAGVGKGTILKKVFEYFPDMFFSVSYTTRTPRPGADVEGKTYCFVSEDEFMRMAEEGKFFEYARVHGHLYGTRRDTVENALAAGKDVMLEIDVQGAELVKEKIPEAVSIFIKPPSMEELARRIRGRGSEAPSEQVLRMKNAENEIARAGEYDFIIINDDIDDAAGKFIDIVKRYREANL